MRARAAGLPPGRAGTRSTCSTRAAARRAAAAISLALAAGLAGCDDQVKYVPWFSTMTETPAVQTYEHEPLPPPEGAVPVGGLEPSYTLAEAGAQLTSPLTPPTAEDIERGRALFNDFCVPCHGPAGEGDGPVVGPNRLPPTPLMNLHSDNARGLSDGYIWGMITNGRGLMPNYGRIPPPDRWYIVAYVRELQRGGGAGQTGAGGDDGGANPGGGAGQADGGAADGGGASPGGGPTDTAGQTDGGAADGDGGQGGQTDTAAEPDPAGGGR